MAIQITEHDVLDAIVRTAAGDSLAEDREGPTCHAPDFRTYPPTIGHDHAGRPVLVTVCESLEGGRWEGFVSHRPIPPALWRRVAG